jgi:hypothetical protein
MIILDKEAFRMGRRLGCSVLAMVREFFEGDQVDKDRISEAMEEMGLIKKMGKVQILGGALPAIMGILNKKIATPKGVNVFEKGAKEPSGTTTGRAHRCRMEGCCGYRVVVKWRNGQTTHPCSKGMVLTKKGWKIT